MYKLRVFGLVAISLIFFTASLAHTAQNDQQESQEPPLRYLLKLDGESVPIMEGEIKKLSGTFKSPEVALVGEPYRSFPYQGITFKYPRSFTFEADLGDPGVKIWTLSGNHFKIMFFVFREQVKTEDIVNNMVKQFGKDNTKLSNTKTTLGKYTLKGRRLSVKVISSNLIIDVYQIPSKGKTTKMLIFQNGLDDSGKRYKEGIEGMKLLSSSFKITE